ncbi:DUF4216 domain-containing protein/Transpos_assoc domain-containing protein, partial [Cephalotus follicularis]
MHKTWIDLRRINPRAYVEGVRMFLNFAYMNKNKGEFICCPCIKCANRYYRGRDTINEHVILDGFLTSYEKWTRHGEGNIGNTVNVSDAMIVDRNRGDDVQVESSLRANMIEMVREGVGIPEVEGNMVDNEEPELGTIVGSDEDSAKFLKLLKDAETELFPNCKEFTTLSFTVELLHLKVLNGWTNKSFTMLLQFLQKVWRDAKILT